jgi:hypothetical protein
MLTCPRKTSREWQDVFARANGNEEEARRIWIEEEFEFNPNLNDPIEDENFEDAREGEPGQQEEETNDDFSKLVQRIKIYINKQIEILKGKKIANTKYKQAKLKELLKAMETMDGVESINIFIKDAYDKAQQVQARFAKLLENKDNMSSKEIMIELTGINDFAYSYSILDEIDSADIMNYFTTKSGDESVYGPVTPQKMLTDAIKIRDKVKKKVVTEAIPLLASYLVEQKSTLQDSTIADEIENMEAEIIAIEANTKMKKSTQEKEIKKITERLKTFKTFDVTQESMERILRMAQKDEGVFDFLVSPLITNDKSVYGKVKAKVSATVTAKATKSVSVKITDPGNIGVGKTKKTTKSKAVKKTNNPV